LGCFVSSSWLSLDGLLSWMTSTPSVKLITISADLLPTSNHLKDTWTTGLMCAFWILLL
jgi:hypothetical protein